MGQNDPNATPPVQRALHEEDHASRIIRQRLTSLRLDLGMTVREAARLAGLSRGGLEKIESGAYLPSIESLTSLCKVYDLKVSTFFELVDVQLGIACSIRRDWPTETMHEQEHQALLETLVRLTGQHQEWELGRSLAYIRKNHPAVFEGLEQIIQNLAPQRMQTKETFPIKQKPAALEHPNVSRAGASASANTRLE
jgi:transcriptional regulator with XRE-family HTH domain